MFLNNRSSRVSAMSITSEIFIFYEALLRKHQIIRDMITVILNLLITWKQPSILTAA
jgi:hypothetical protein